MTAPGGDVLAWLESAIREREALAQEACSGGKGRWHSGWYPEDELEEGESTGAGVSDERDRTVVYDEGRPDKAQSLHIAANDPESVLRRCTADRKLLELHAPTTGYNAYGGSYPACSACGAAEEYPVRYPCPTVLALAEGYGRTEGER